MSLYSNWSLLSDGTRLVAWIWAWILTVLFAESKVQKQELRLKQIITTSSPEKLQTQSTSFVEFKSNPAPPSPLSNHMYRKFYNGYVPHFFQFEYHNRKKLVLDLDETLISSSQKHISKHDIAVEIYLNGSPATFYVQKRPHVDHFLDVVSQWYEVVIFTASLSVYANAVIDKLDPHRRINRRFYRQSCANRQGSYIKDLQIVCGDLSKVAIIDNSPAAYSVNKDNGIAIEDWIGNNPSDQALLNLLPLLSEMKDIEDVRHIVKSIPKGLGSSKPMEYSSPVMRRSNHL